MEDNIVRTYVLFYRKDKSIPNCPCVENNKKESTSAASSSASKQPKLTTGRGDGQDLKRGRHIGRKKAKYVHNKNRQNEQALRNGAAIAASMQRWTDLLAEQNALATFSLDNCETDEDRKERSEFLRLFRRSHLKRIRDSMELYKNFNINTKADQQDAQPEQPIDK